MFFEDVDFAYELEGTLNLESEIDSCEERERLSKRWGNLFKYKIEFQGWEFGNSPDEEMVRLSRVVDLNELAKRLGIGFLQDYNITRFKSTAIRMGKVQDGKYQIVDIQPIVMCDFDVNKNKKDDGKDL